MLSVERLKCQYGKVVALHDLSLEVERGELVSLIGANGAGKTTTLKAISGVLAATGGRISFEGEDITRASPRRILQLGIAHCPEGRRVFPAMTVRENLEMGGYLRRDAAGTQADMQRLFERFPILRERREQAAGMLSGGEQQMLALGRALVAKPRLLLVDELSLGLAPLIVEAIYKQLIVVGATLGTSMLIVEQNARIALEFAATAFVLDRGRIVLSGTAEEVAASDAMHESYLGARREAGGSEAPRVVQ